MATGVLTRKRHTFDEFCALLPEDTKADLINGVIYVSPSDNTVANDICGWLGSLMYGFAECFDLGRVFGQRVACKFDEFNAAEPDIQFVPSRWRKRILHGWIAGPPAVAVEVVSPDSRRRDYGLKRNQYENFGVSEYWIIDEPKRTTTFLRLQDGKFHEVELAEGVFRSRALRGFWFRSEWLWPETRSRNIVEIAELIRSTKDRRRSKHGKE